MAGYSDSEIEAAVGNFVKSEVSVQRDPLGPVDLAAKFNEVIQLTSSTLIFDPNAIFYLIFLATNKLNTSVLTAIEYVEDIQQAIQEVSKRTKDVTRTTLLGDAAAALLTVDSILTSSDAISQTAFDRYKRAVADFTDVSLAPNVKDAGEIVRAPQLARKEVVTTLQNLSALWPEILDGLTQIEEELSDFLSLNLPVNFVQRSIRRVRDDLISWQNTFESASTTRDDKIAECRDAYLSLTSGKSVLDNYTTVTDPTDPRVESSDDTVGRAALPVGDEGALNVPEDTCTKSGPWSVVTGVNDEFKVAADGALEVTYTLVPPSQPSLTGFVAHEDATEFYEITAGVNDRLEIDGLAPTIALTAGVGRTTTQIVSDISTWITANYPGLYSASVVTAGGRSFVKITKTQNGVQRLRITADDVADASKIERGWQALGFWIGQEDSNEGISASEFVEQLNDAGDFLAETETTLYEEGTNGEVTSATVFEVPIDTIASLDHADDMLLVRNAENAGYHRIVSIVRVAGVDRITVDAGTPFLAVTTDQNWQIVRDVLTIRSKATDLTTELVIGAGSANSTLGFTAGTLKGATTGFRVSVSGVDEDFSRRDVVEGDLVRVSKGPGYAETEHTVLELSDSNRQLELDPPVDVDLNTTTYPDLQFEVLSAAAVAYEAFIEEVAAWRELLEASDYSEDILELGRVMNPLIANKNPSIAQINDAEAAADELYELLTNASPPGLTEVLTGFEVEVVPRVDAALNMLKERSLDRAYDELMDGDIASFFGMDKDDASSSGYMLKTARSVVQEDLRTSKLDDDVDEVAHWDEVEDTDADFDYTDADEDENIEILGEIPDYDDEGDVTTTERVRY
jgi:hypothetical protein